MRLHRALLWSLRAEHTRQTLAWCDGIPTASFQRQWVSGPTSSFAVATVRFYATALVEDIELWLRTHIAAELRRLNGTGWWSALPAAVRQRAAYRHKLACADFGKRRAGSAHSADWLSLGDVIKILEALSSISWSRCLEATSRRRHAFSIGLRRVKAFRDSRIAHWQSGGPTQREVSRLLRRIDLLCEVLRPEDYSRAIAARSILKNATGETRSQLFELYEPSMAHQIQRRLRLRDLRSIVRHLNGAAQGRIDVEFCDALLQCCAEAAGTISPFVGDA